MFQENEGVHLLLDRGTGAGAINGGEIWIEVSIDRTNWIRLPGIISPFQQEGDIVLAPRALQPGVSFVRITGARKSPSEAVAVKINRLPVPEITFLGLNQKTGEYEFSGSKSYDPDGQIVAYTWTVDGKRYSGRDVSFAIPAQSDGIVELLLADNDGGEKKDGKKKKKKEGDGGLTFPPHSIGCICTDVELRKEQLANPLKVLGPKADGSKAWLKKAGIWDGINLGPLAINPQNKSVANGTAKYATGYGFEVVFKVDGDPDLCLENQFIKLTRVSTGADLTREVCEGKLQGRWDGSKCTSDFQNKKIRTQKDGSTIEVTDKTNCEALGGKWVNDECIFSFPQGGGEYGVDQEGTTSMSAVWTYKQHVKDKKTVIWVDVPSIYGDDRKLNIDEDADFLSFLRGTDKKYCYVQMQLNLKRRSNGQDTERLFEKGKKVGSDTLP